MIQFPEYSVFSPWISSFHTANQFIRINAINKLAINVDKTKCMFFHKRRAITLLTFSMNNRAIDVVHNLNYVGIMLNPNMSWKSHIAMVSNSFPVLMNYLID